MEARSQPPPDCPGRRRPPDCERPPPGFRLRNREVEVRTRILLTDDHEPYRRQLRALLAGEADLEVVAVAKDGLSALRLVADLEPDVVLMDVAMPQLNGIETTREIVRAFPGIKVIGLSMHRERGFVDSMLRAGASGYVLKEQATVDLPAALRTVAGGGIYLSPALE